MLDYIQAIELKQGLLSEFAFLNGCIGVLLFEQDGVFGLVLNAEFIPLAAVDCYCKFSLLT